MNAIQEIKRQKQCRLFLICERILSCIRAKIQIAMSCSIRISTYTFRTVNTHGSPMFPIRRVLKIRKYIVKKLQNEGFLISENYETDTPDTEWSLLIKW